MFVWTLNDIITAIIVGAMLLCMIIFFLIVFVVKLIDWFSRWRPYKGEKETKEVSDG